jgi:uncharacterized membrane protein YjgN (DUF898 family)
MEQGSVAAGQQAGQHAAQPQRYPIEFTATAGQYFRIWIVNLALSIVTLGLYSPWAKVRRHRYFYGCTRIDGEGFEYRADPVAILKGRLIALAILAVFYGTGYYDPLWQLALWIPLILIAPWLIVRSLAFNAYNTAYRNIRLRFDGTYKGCVKILVLYGLLMAVTLGLAYPFLKRRLVQFAMQHHSYGTTRFALADTFKGPFIRGYAVAYGIAILLGLLMIGGIVAGAALAAGSKGDPKAVLAFIPLGIFAFYGGMFFLFAYLRARTVNAVWNHLAIGPARFESRLRARDLVWIYFSNLVVIAFTLGLMTPWAVVRTMRYRASKTTAIADAPLGGYAQAESQQVSATGEEVGEMFAFDFGL